MERALQLDRERKLTVSLGAALPLGYSFTPVVTGLDVEDLHELA
jgi:hypothetical protein